jgi:hypothetical protein
MIIPTRQLQFVGVALIAAVAYGLQYLNAYKANEAAVELVLVTSIIWVCGAAAGVVGYALWVEGKQPRKS